MFLGIDISTYLEQQRLTKQIYYHNGKPFNPIQRFLDQGVSMLRVRIWNNPYDENHEPYLGGTCDLDNAINLYNELKSYNFSYLIDFHYSDFWADPAKQFLPKAWKDLSYDELIDAIYLYTKGSLLKLKEVGVPVSMVQVGNEITHGMLWPHASLYELDHRKERFIKLSTLLKSAIKGVKEVYPDAEIVIHLERSYDIACYDEYISELINNNVPFDIIGTSYYPFWHHNFDEYFACQDMVRNKYHVKVMNAELGFPFTLIDYRDNEATNDNHLVINTDNIEDFKKLLPCEISKEGQAEFIRRFIALAKEHHFEGLFYWEPLWVPGEGICWASKKAQEYQNDKRKDTRNEWANQCLFDYDANANPAFDEYKLK